MWFATEALAICFAGCCYHFFKLLDYGKPKDLSKPIGQINPAVKYAFTRAMDPRKKESAFLHLPTYIAGIIYHLGTFLSFALFVMIWLNFAPSGWLRYAISSFLLVSALNGTGILIKRIINKNLRSLSNPDDYLSNFLVTTFHFVGAFTLINSRLFPVYFVTVGILLLYLPVGKLKHTIYFFAARYQLGVFYGRRGVWPPKKEEF